MNSFKKGTDTFLKKGRTLLKRVGMDQKIPNQKIIIVQGKDIHLKREVLR